MERVVHTQRFEVVRRLGAGATGVVYEAENRTSGERVALKALERLDARSLYRFKREFRALAGVSHPNLVTLNELFHEGGRWYLSMELVQGRSFVEYVRGRGAGGARLDLPRLRAALAQLVQALAALHEAGRLHRDIKPTNVLVTEQGCVKVLDFGFVRELDTTSALESAEVVGTPAYMAPEQAEAGRTEPASDWYAVGVMLFEALTGRLPFEGASTRVLLDKLEGDAPRVLALWPEVPPDLDALCAALLARDASQRPHASALLERVGAGAGLAPTPRAQPSDLFVGRASLLASLHEALESARREVEPRIVALTGASAMGKTALLERFACEVAERGAWTLCGRCHEREDVPYKALDGIVDTLVRRLGELSELELALLLPRYLGALTLQFPVLLRVPAIAEQAARYVPPGEANELRRHAALALQELLARIADHRPLVLLIDDLQWGDVESIQLLRDALSPEDMPGVLWVAAHRSDERPGSPALTAFDEALSTLGRRAPIAHFTLAPLEQADAEELARRLLGVRVHDQASLAHLAREAGGVPLFVHELARHVLAGGARDATLEQVVEERIARLSPTARALLEIVALTRAPLPIAVARALLERGAGSPRHIEDALRELLHERLARQSYHPAESIDIRHEQLRTIVKRTVAPEAAVGLHLALARQLAGHGADPELLAHHFLSAGDPASVAHAAARAAEAAAEALAFVAAARCYELSLSWGRFSREEKRPLLIGLAEALAGAGRGSEAGEAYLRAALAADSDERPALLSRAVDQLLRAGHMEAGLALGDELLRELGIGRAHTGSRALVGLLARRAWLWLRGYQFTRKEPDAIEPRALHRVEAARAMSLALGHMDPFAAAHMQARHLMLALESGDGFAVARALGYEAVYLAIEGAPQSNRALALLDRQQVLMREGTPREVPYLHAFGQYAQGVIEWGRGHWPTALASLDAAESSYQSAGVGAAWEMLAAQLLAFGSLLYLGRWDELSRRVTRSVAQAEQRDDRLTLQWVFAWQAVTQVLRGDLRASEQSLARATARLPQSYYTLPHLFALCASTCASLHVGDGARAHARIQAEWGAIRKSQLLRLQVYRIETLRLRAVSALSAARVDQGAKRSLLLSAERDLERIDDEDVPWGHALALALRGELKHQQGAADAALISWELADERLRAAHMEGFAAATRRRIGLALGGEQGTAMVRAADAWFVSRGIGDPERAIRLHLA